MNDWQMAARKYDFFFLKLKFLQETSKNKKIRRVKEYKICGKIKYETKSEARIAADFLEKRTKKEKGVIKQIYFCKGCSAYHITREEKIK